MFWRVTKSVLILPGTALIYIPLLIQWATGGWPFGGSVSGTPQIVLAVILAVPAIMLAIRTVTLFVQEGEGTPAPWDPPTKFVVRGPYRYVRNPMLSSVVVLILAEALALGSQGLLGWAIFFFVLNTVYFHFSEEPALERRFGEPYARYKASVPRWIPQIQPYEATDGS